MVKKFTSLTWHYSMWSYLPSLHASIQQWLPKLCVVGVWNSITPTCLKCNPLAWEYQKKGGGGGGVGCLLESIGLQVVDLKKLKLFLLDDHDTSRKLKFLDSYSYGGWSLKEYLFQINWANI